MFLHIGLMHLLFNLFVLKDFGPSVERLDAQAVALRTQDEQSAEQLHEKEMEFERAGEELKRALSGKNGISPEPQ
jgi:hypothetical protein